MSETTKEPTFPKKMVSLNVAVALGIICIIVVVVSLVGAFAYYTPILNGKDNTISSLNLIISQSNTNNTNLQNQINDLNNIVDLNMSRIWVLNQTIIFPAGSYASFVRQDTDYAGYVSFIFQTSMSNTTYVQAIYSSNGSNYDYQAYVGTSGTASLPVLPTPSIYIRIGDTLNAVNVQMTVIYYY